MPAFEGQRILQAQEIFDELMALPADERPAALLRRCEHDAPLRTCVEKLLAWEQRGMGSFLSSPVLTTTLDWPQSGASEPVVAPAPTRIGRYEIVRVIAEGGMGTVYEARQEHPSRRVALKVIRHGFATPTMLRRFQYEAEVLGRLQHPGIAQIFEAGAAVTADTPAGPVEQPFFAMEYVEGPPLTEYARRQNLDTRQRLELVARVCDAVQHAHQKGVIHRDLKPANILVAEGDDGTKGPRDPGIEGIHESGPRGAAPPDLSPSVPRSLGPSIPLPKILDFGVARTTDADLRTVTFATATGQLIGTLAYMSPEQVSGDPAQLDTRSDVYSLGVILYELLSGKLPHDVTTCSIAEAARKIRDEEPDRLTTHDRFLSGDLQVLVGKAMAKDKTRRYQSAAALGDDLRRYLTGEPIEARRDSRWYLVRKAVARHRGAAAAAVAFVLLLAASTVALAFMYGGQVRERKRATAAAARAEAVNTFLENMLWSVDPQYSPDAEVTVRQVLDQAVAEIEAGSLAEQPELEAALRATLGQTYSNLGRYPQAEKLLEGALEAQRRLFGERSIEVGDVLTQLGALRHYQGRYAEAEPLLADALAIRLAILGPAHPEVASVLHNLGAAHHALGNLEQAEIDVRQALAIRRAAFDHDHPEIAGSLNNLATVLGRRGQNQEAEVLYREILAMDRRRWKGRLTPAIDAGNNLAFLLQARGDYAEAELHYRESLALSRQVLGDRHPTVATALNNLAALQREVGDLESAASAAREGLDIRRESLPASHPHLARSALLLGHIKLEQNQPAEAEPLLRECLDIRRKSMDPGHYLIAEAASVLGECLTKLERYEEAEPLLLESYPIIKSGRGERHERTLDAARRLRDLYAATGRPEKAAALSP